METEQNGLQIILCQSDSSGVNMKRIGGLAAYNILFTVRSIIKIRLHITGVAVRDPALSFVNNLQESPLTLGLDIAKLLPRKQDHILPSRPP